MSDQPVTVTYKGRVDDDPSSALTVSAHGATRVLPLGEPVEVPRGIAERCEELREAYRFEVKGLSSGGGSSSSSRGGGSGGES